MKYWGCSGSDRKKIFFQQPSDLKVFFFWLSDWLTDQLNNWMADWYTFGIEFLLAMILTLSINSAVGFTSLKSWFFFTKIHFFQKLLEYLIIHAVHSKDLAEVYTLIPIFLFIDTYLGATLQNLLIFRENLEILIIFWY